MDMDNERSSKEEDEVPASSKAELIRAKLGPVGHYLMLGFAPVVSVLALIVAVMAYSGNQANRAQLNEANSRIDSIGAVQSETRGEMDIFKVPLAREKALLAEERKKQAEQVAVIVENVSRLQVKMKVSPTLEEQLRDGSVPHAASSPAASAPAAAPVVATAASAPVAAPVVVAPVVPKVDVAPKAEKKTVVQPATPAGKPAPAKDAKKPAPAAKDAGKKSAPAPTGADKATKTQTLKKAIEEYNRISK